MPLQRYGFIVKSADLDMFKHQGQIASETFGMSIAGVCNIEEAMLVAQEMLTRRIQLIELCGGFNADDAQKVRDAINDHIPVGVVQYTDQQRQRLANEFGCPE